MKTSYAIDNSGNPRLYLTFSSDGEAESFRSKITPTGKGGSIRKRVLTLSGKLAVQTASSLGIDVPEFRAWSQKGTPNYLISDQQVLDDARQFTSRVDWKKQGKFYQLAHKHRPHLLEQCTAHMRAPIDPTKSFQVYVYEFENKTAYVGLTCNPERRHGDGGHLHSGHVANQIKKGISYQLKTIAENLTPTEAEKLEQETIAAYQESWIVLNRHKGGSFGQLRMKYTYEQALNEARKHTHKMSFIRANKNMHQSIARTEMWELICQEMGWPDHKDHKWTSETCLEEALKHPTLSSWYLNQKASYVAASRNGWLQQIRSSVFTSA